MLEGLAPTSSIEHVKSGHPKMQFDKDAVFEKYSSEGLIGLDPVALAHQLCIIDLGMLKEIRCAV